MEPQLIRSWHPWVPSNTLCLLNWRKRDFKLVLYVNYLNLFLFFTYTHLWYSCARVMHGAPFVCCRAYFLLHSRPWSEIFRSLLGRTSMGSIGWCTQFVRSLSTDLSPSYILLNQ